MFTHMHALAYLHARSFFSTLNLIPRLSASKQVMYLFIFQMCIFLSELETRNYIKLESFSLRHQQFPGSHSIGLGKYTGHYVGLNVKNILKVQTVLNLLYILMPCCAQNITAKNILVCCAKENTRLFLIFFSYYYLFLAEQ